MPTILRLFGFVFFFYSHEHEPPHIHVEGKGGYAKYEWNGTTFVLKEVVNVKKADIKNISGVIDDNADLILQSWNNYFSK